MNTPSPTILVIGSVAWDEIVYLEHPLRAGSHNGGQRREARIGGGAANTAMALAVMGPAWLRLGLGLGPEANYSSAPVVISAVGRDEEGQALRRKLGDLGVCVDYIDYRGEETTRSLVLLDKDGERTVINLARARVPLPPHLATMPADACYARSADPALTPVLEQRVRDGGLVVAHIPPIQGPRRPARVLVGSASDLDAAFCADPFPVGQRIAGQSLEWVVITDGPNGATAHGQNAQGNSVILRAAAPRVPVRDSTGAGDVFAAGLTFALAQGQAMPQALQTAVRWGTASVGYEGTVPSAFRFPAAHEIPVVHESRA